MTKFPEHVFRAYDIRGIYGKDLTEELAKAVGKAFGTMIGNRGRVIVGRDVRLSGEALANAVIEGLSEAGCDVLSAGIVTTPMLYFSIVHLNLDGGIQVTASHNPPEWNGFKLVRHGGETVSEGAGMEELKRLVLENGGKEGARKGSVSKIDIVKPYIEFVTSRIKVKPGLRLAVDYSNGAVAVVFPKIAETLGLDVRAINEVPDGSFPGHLPEPNEETLKPLQRFVVDVGADLGAGFDGDGDRVVFVDDKGRLITGDTALAIYIKFLDKKGKVIYDVNCSSALREIIIKEGFEPVEMRVGRAFILNAMRETGAVIGGEKSNHLYFPEIYGFDDAIYATLKMAEIFSKSGRKISELVEEIPRYPSTPIITFDCPDELKEKVVNEIAKHYESLGLRVNKIDGVKVYFEDGWVLVRPSNTMPQVKMAAEAKTEERLRKIVEEAENLIKMNIERFRNA